MPIYTPYMEGARRAGEDFFTGPGLPTAMGTGTAALTEDQILRDLLAQLQAFSNSTVTDVAGLEGTIDPNALIGGGGIGGEASGPTDDGSGPRLNPEVLSSAATVLGPLAQLTNSEPLGLIANMTGMAGNLAMADPTSAALAMTQNFANLAGANPIVTSTIGALINAARDPVDYTNQDIAGKLIDIALSPTPFNVISNIITGKTIGQQFKAANTPVEEALPGGNVSELLAEQANQLAKETNSDPLDALMAITNSFNTGPQAEASPNMQMMDLAASMIGMKADPETAAVAGDLTQYGPSLADILAAQDAFAAEAAAQAEAPAAESTSSTSAVPGLDLTSIDAGLAAFGMDTGGASGDGGLWGGDGGDGLT